MNPALIVTGGTLSADRPGNVDAGPEHAAVGLHHLHDDNPRRVGRRAEHHHPNPSTIQFTSPALLGSIPFVLEEYPDGASTDVNILLNYAGFPDSPDVVTPLTPFDTTVPFGTTDHRDNYGGRVQGYFMPPASGNYDFYMNNDDGAFLYINPNGIDPAGKVKIAELNPACCQAWPVISSLGVYPDGIPLEAGKPYYLEGLYQEAAGGDLIQVATRLHGDSSVLAAIPASQIAPSPVPPGQFGVVTITEQPQSQSVVAYQACFSVAGTSEIGGIAAYRWFKNGMEFPGATGPTLCAFFAPADNGAALQAEVAIPGYIARSDVATVTVEDDTVPPVAVAAQGTSPLTKRSSRSMSGWISARPQIRSTTRSAVGGTCSLWLRSN